MTDKIIVLSTCGSSEEAENLARKLVTQRLAACVNVIQQVQSFYWWQGAVTNGREWLLVIKTARELFPELRSMLESSHSYELPEILAMPVVEGSTNYLLWMERELKSADIG